MLGSGRTRERILEAYPHLEPDDLNEAITYAAWRLEEREEAEFPGCAEAATQG